MTYILCWKSKTIITHTAINGPSGFKSKHLNFFCRRCYRVKILIFRKCHLGNFPQIHFNPIKAGGSRSMYSLKTLSCFLWIFYNICFHINGRDPQFCNLSWTVKRHIVVKIKVQSQLPDWLDTAWKSLFVWFLRISLENPFYRQYLNSHTVHLCLWFFAKTCHYDC